MPVTLNNTNITINDGTNNFVLETVKTHVPEVDIEIDIVPVITNSDGDPAFELLTYTHSGGSEDQTEFNLTINENTTCDILIVGGGGGGGHNGGGGGGGDVLYFSRVEIPIGTYVVKVGRGGTGVTGSNTGATTHGIKSEFYNIVAGGGGRGMAFSFTNIAEGISVTENYINPLTGVSSTSKGGNGGVRNTSNGGATKGGDGAGGIALPVTSDNAATDGGPGIYNDITGTNIGYGGGGGGRDVSVPEHHGNGVDGGASSRYGPSAISGRGGGGASEFNSGGSGIVILRKYIEPVALYEEQTENPDYKILTFKYQEPSYPVIDDLYNQTSYTVNFPEESECDILIVGGGGGGGDPHGGGGGAGQLVFIHQATLNGTYSVKVGNGGIGGLYNTRQATKGKDSSFHNVIAEGGGANSNTASDKDGGSGAGGDGYTFGGGTAGAGSKNTNIDTFSGAIVYSRGNNGGIVSSVNERAGGGGGAGSIGESGSFTIPGKGGDGLSGISEINYDFKTNFGNYGNLEADGKYYFAGGGGGGNSTAANGSKGGGGNGGWTNTNMGGNGVATTGSGGGGGGGGTDAAGGDGGSGIVIIRYKTKYIRQHPAYDAQWTYHSANPNVHHYGNVGIGTLASETNKLTVKGDINVIGDIYENNNKIAYGWDVSGNSVYNKYGNVGIGTNDPRYALHTTGVIYAGQGGITENTSTSWTVTSDNRIKENIEKASYDICSENIKNINLYRFNYNTKYVKTTDKNQLGFIAQDVRKYFPKAVKNKTTRFDNDVVPNLLSVDVTQLNYTMYGAVKHIGQDIDAIKEKLGITEVPNDFKNQPYFTEVIPFNDPDV